MIEPRRSIRRRILKSGLICFNARHSTLPCVVRDFSENGARLRVTGSINAPDTFELFIELDGIWVDCEVVRRNGEEVGVEFTSEIKRVTPRRAQVLGSSAERPQVATLRRRPINRQQTD